MVVLPFNHARLAAARIEREAGELAAVIVDPVPNRVGLIPARAEFLHAIREVTAAHGILLIFDEVISFRVGYRGAQGAFGVRPDLTTFGKIIGGGFPVGAVGGRADVMDVFDPRGGKPAVPHGGTFNANPVTMAAGLAAMRLMDETAYGRLEELGEKLRTGFRACLDRAGVAGAITGMGSLFRIHPAEQAFVDYRSTLADEGERKRLDELHRALLNHGVLISPSGLGCVSTAVTDAEIEYFLEIVNHCVRAEAGLAPAVRRVAPGGHEERHVVVAVGIGHREPHGDDLQEWRIGRARAEPPEVGADVERDLVMPHFEVSQQRSVGAAIAVGHRRS